MNSAARLEQQLEDGLSKQAKDTLNDLGIRLYEVFDYLDELRDSGVTNMFGAGTYIQEEFCIVNRRVAGELLTSWMKSFTVTS